MKGAWLGLNLASLAVVAVVVYVAYQLVKQLNAQTAARQTTIDRALQGATQ